MRRIERLWKILAKKRISSFLVTDLLNIRYLTGFTGSLGYLLLSERKSLFFTDFRYQEQAKREVKADEIRIIEKNFFVEPPAELRGLKMLAFEEHSLTYSSYSLLKKKLRGVRLLPLRDLTAELRVQKDERERDLIREAAKITDYAFSSILNFLKPGLTEREVALQIDLLIREKGEIAFPTIVASGKNAALPHARPSDKKIKSGESIVFDIGARFQGYASDMTRTIFIGSVPGNLVKVYQIVKDAQEKAIAELRPGKATTQIDSIARNYVKEKGYGEYFRHSLGHGVGLAVHEKPILSQLSLEIIPVNSVLTVEPGIYLPDIGGVRIEDLLVVKENGVKVLSKSPRELMVI